MPAKERYFIKAKLGINTDISARSPKELKQDLFAYSFNLAYSLKMSSKKTEWMQIVWFRQATHFLATLSTFLGIGLIASALIKYPTHPTRFTLLAIIGSLLFFLSSIAEEYFISDRPLFQNGTWKRIFGSFAFSSGVGALSASIQDFSKIPHHTIFTIPLAVTIAFFGFFLRKCDKCERADLIRLGAFGILCILISWLAVYGLVRLNTIS